MSKYFDESKVSAVFLTALLLSTSACSMMPLDKEFEVSNSTNTVSDVGSINSGRGFSGSFYAAAGLGVSRLEPDTNERADVDVNDPTNAGGQITMGTDLSRQLSLELHSADLGSAGLSPTGRINYHIHGASALFYVGKNRKRYKRAGLNAYGRLGYAVMDNSGVGDVEYQTVNKNHILLGLGMEYATRSGLGVRAELISFEEDAKYAQLALVYRIGKKRDQFREIVAYTEPVLEVKQEPRLINPVPALVVMDQDSESKSESESVQDTNEDCSSTQTNFSMEYKDCSLFAGLIEITFHNGSYLLTDTAQNILDSVATTLENYPDVKLQVKAHADSKGRADFNLLLSKNRGKSVVEYLVGQGIEKKRLQATAHGETQPVDTNATNTGRLNNRRVELLVTK